MRSEELAEYEKKSIQYWYDLLTRHKDHLERFSTTINMEASYHDDLFVELTFKFRTTERVGFIG